MGADLEAMLGSLAGFYDFTDKVVLWVGAGGGQLLEAVRAARQVIAIDQDEDALRSMAALARKLGLGGRVTTLHARWEDVRVTGDVVYFEFCLHEMADPEAALAHARTLAPEVLVFDHAAESEWAHCTGEGDLVRRSAAALAKSRVGRRQEWLGEQRYADYAELWGRVSRDPRTREGDLAAYRGQREISISMACFLATVV